MIYIHKWAFQIEEKSEGNNFFLNKERHNDTHSDRMLMCVQM